MWMTKRGQMFLQADISSYAAENNNWIQLVVVFWFKHNITMRILNKIQLILESNLDFQGFINVIQTHPNPEVQPMVEFRVSFIRVTKCGQIFLRPDMSSHAAKNRKWIQPVVVLCCKHNTIMRIYTKIQLILEFNLGFQGFANVAPTNQPRNTTYDWTWSWIFDIYNLLNATPCVCFVRSF